MKDRVTLAITISFNINFFFLIIKTDSMILISPHIKLNPFEITSTGDTTVESLLKKKIFYRVLIRLSGHPENLPTTEIGFDDNIFGFFRAYEFCGGLSSLSLFYLLPIFPLYPPSRESNQVSGTSPIYMQS